MDKYIFLDIDGVVNIPPYDKFNKRCLYNLYSILDNTGAEIIISSSWREGDIELTKASFIKHGFDPEYAKFIKGETCRGYKYVKQGSNLPIVRGNEIKWYIDTHIKYPWHAFPDRTKEFTEYREDGTFKMMRSRQLGVEYTYVILDDDTDMLYDQRHWFVNTDSHTGLTVIDAHSAIHILNSKSKQKTEFSLIPQL